MKHFLFIICLTLSGVAQAQSDATESGFGFALNSSYNNQLNTIGIAPTVLYYYKNSQFELGAGLNPFSLKNQRVASGEFNYKYFPNGRSNKFNMYFMTSFAYANQLKKTYFSSTYQYLFLAGGYGFQVSVVDNLNLGTNLSLGSFTRSNNSDNPYLEQLGAQSMFDNLGMHMSFQVHVGYRF